MQRAGEITQLLRAHRDGEERALDRVVDLLYADLRDVARRLRPRAGGSLDTVALLHEAYLKLVRHGGLDVQDREHFKAVAARAMRQIAVDHARTRLRAKRGAGAAHVDLDDAPGVASTGPSADDILTVHSLLEELAERDEQLVRVVECRFFGGMRETETAEALGVSVATVQRKWQQARAHLTRALDVPGAEPDGSATARS